MYLIVMSKFKTRRQVLDAYFKLQKRWMDKIYKVEVETHTGVDDWAVTIRAVDFKDNDIVLFKSFEWRTCRDAEREAGLEAGLAGFVSEVEDYQRGKGDV